MCAMDACCERTSRLLCQGSRPIPCGPAKLVEKSGLARSTVMLHLKYIEEGSPLAKEEIRQARVGRPEGSLRTFSNAPWACSGQIQIADRIVEGRHLCFEQREIQGEVGFRTNNYVDRWGFEPQTFRVQGGRCYH